MYNPLLSNLKANMTLSHFLLHYWHYLFDFFPLAQNFGVKVAPLVSGKSRHPRNLFWKVLSFSAKWHKQAQVKHYCCLLTNVSHFLVMPLKHGFHLKKLLRQDLRLLKICMHRNGRENAHMLCMGH